MLEINKIHQGDCLEILKSFPDNSVDAIITDPPYGLEFMGKEWDKFKEGKNIAGGTTGEGTPFGRSKPLNSVYQYTLEQKNIMQQFFQEWAKECLRVLKFGGYLLSFSSTRTYHRMVCGIENAGFEIRDTIMWIYGVGFPKSLNIGKQIDKIQGNEREIIEGGQIAGSLGNNLNMDGGKANPNYNYTKGNSEWEGWGTALKPACEPIVMARKPLSEKNVALNVLRWGTGGINIDACRISHNEPAKLTNRTPRKEDNIFSDDSCGFKKEVNHVASASQQGRFPANIILDEEAGQILDQQSGISKSSGGSGEKSMGALGDTKYGKYNKKLGENAGGLGDIGGASRFFYCAKASKNERNLGRDNLPEKNLRYEDGSSRSLEIFSNQYTENSENPTNRGKTPLHRNNHPTVKPIKLMEYLIKLVTPKNGLVLDTFGGSGTTALACINLGFNYLLIEKEADYIEIAKTRINHFLQQKKLEVSK